MLNPDSWRKHRSIKKSDPMVLQALDNRKLFEGEELQSCCSRLREKAGEWELLFGEIMLLNAFEDKDKTAKVYFPFIWSCAKPLKPLIDLYIWEILDERAERILRDLSDKSRLYAMRWINRARRSEYNMKPQEPVYGMRSGPVSAHRQNTYSHFYHSISFPENYTLPPSARLSTVYKYFLWLHGAEYNESYIDRTLSISYQKLKPLHDKPFCQIRPEDVISCMEGQTVSQKNKIVVLYRKLDSLAYEKDLIPRRYALSMHHIRNVPPAPSNDFTQAEIDELRLHEGEIEVDITLVLLYTGLYIRELCALTTLDVDDQYISLPNDRIVFYGRRIPIHPVIARSLRHVLRYMEERDIQNVAERRRRYGIFEMVLTATEKYCDSRHSAMQCRASFESRLKEAGASDGILIYLTGTLQPGLMEYQRAYIHPRPERIYEAVMNMQ